MCGIFFCTKQVDLDVTYLNRRGPDSQYELHTPFGYFYQSRLISNPNSDVQPYNINDNFIMINGTIYNSSNEKDYFDNFNFSNLELLHQQISSLDGEFALVIVNESQITLATDCFGTKPLYFYYDEHYLAVSSVRSIILQNFPTAYHMPKNTIFSFERKNHRLQKQSTTFDFDLEQKHNHWDYVHEAFDHVMQKMTNQPAITGLSVSSGLDSGVIDCWLTNHKPVHCTVSHLNSDNEDTILLKQRSKIRKSKIDHPINHLVDQSQEIKDCYGSDNLYLTRNLWNRGVQVQGAICQTLKNYGIKILLCGTGGDEMYSDYAQNGIPTANHSVINGIWPKDLVTVWPWFDEFKWLSSGLFYVDFVGGLNGLESRFPLVDKHLVQAWLNTTQSLKNSAYKSWMVEYMKMFNYPYSVKKFCLDDPIK